MAVRRLGIVMNGVTGRMGTNQHLVRSIVAIRREGGVALKNGDRVMPDPILVGRSESKLSGLAKAHGLERISTSLDAALADNDTGRRLRESCSFLVVPMVDLDGVEAGDQGKRRHPHDHNGDYIDAPLYPETRAIRDLVHRCCDDRLRLCLDLHCPWVRGDGNESIYIVGSQDPANAARQRRLADALESVRTGPLPYRAASTLPYGQGWNVRKPESTLVPFSRWMIAHAPGTPSVATIEFPYANADGAMVTASSARAFGRDVAYATAAICGLEAR